MKTLERELILSQENDYLLLGGEIKRFRVTSSKLIFQADDHSITSFKTTTNDISCQIVVNCGLTPPQIFFAFNDITEDMEIDHDYQTEVINALKELEARNSG